jgi:hypothetical protein
VIAQIAKNSPDAMNIRPDQKSFGLLIFILSSGAAYSGLLPSSKGRQSVTRSFAGLACGRGQELSAPAEALDILRPVDIPYGA